MKNKFFNVDYIPNKLVFVYHTDKDSIYFLAFFNEKGEGMKAVKHGISKKSKKDFKPVKPCFAPIQEVKDLINNELTYKID